MYRVLFTTESEGIKSIEWAPKEGDDFECSQREAERRMKHLLAKGRAGKMVDNAVPYIVEIVDETGKVMLGQTTKEGDEPYGVWAPQRMAA